MASIFRPPAPGQSEGSTEDFSTSGAPRPRSIEVPEEAVPHLLVQLQDDLARSRMREAFWISVVTHMVLIVLILFAPKLLPVHPVQVVAFNPNASDRELTFLNLPPDLQKPAQRPRTNILSDKDRIASSRNPVLDRRELQKILNAERPGASGRGPQPTPTPVRPSAPPQQAQAQVAQVQPQQGQQAAAPPQQAPNNNALLQPVQPPAGSGNTQVARNSPFQVQPGLSSVERAAEATAHARPTFGGGGDGNFGAGLRSHGALSNFEVLSDTHGVDFGPYLRLVYETVRDRWFLLMPESAKSPFFASGKVTVEFRILKNGAISDVMVTQESGRGEMDKAALGSITFSNPFRPLPKEFPGDDLRLRFRYYYNPAKGELGG